jgi:hypothetical protein
MNYDAINRNEIAAERQSLWRENGNHFKKASLALRRHRDICRFDRTHKRVIL